MVPILPDACLWFYKQNFESKLHWLYLCRAIYEYKMTCVDTDTITQVIIQASQLHIVGSVGQAKVNYRSMTWKEVVLKR